MSNSAKNKWCPFCSGVLPKHFEKCNFGNLPSASDLKKLKDASDKELEIKKYQNKVIKESK